MNIKPTKLKTTLSILVPICYSVYSFFWIYYAKCYDCPSDFQKGIALNNLPSQSIATVVVIVVIYLIWSLIQKKK
jgi:hypothetical protein